MVIYEFAIRNIFSFDPSLCLCAFLPSESRKGRRVIQPIEFDTSLTSLFRFTINIIQNQVGTQLYDSIFIDKNSQIENILIFIEIVYTTFKAKEQKILSLWVLIPAIQMFKKDLATSKINDSFFQQQVSKEQLNLCQHLPF